MQGLLVLSRGIDRLNQALGLLAAMLVLLTVLICAGNATVRYLFHYSSNGFLEIQWYFFGAIVLLGASVTLQRNEHVRVDLLYMLAPERRRLWIDIAGILLFLLPVCVYLTYLCWNLFVTSFRSGEYSLNAGGLIVWPAKALLPLGFALLTLQGISELIKRIAALRGMLTIDTAYDKPLQ